MAAPSTNPSSNAPSGVAPMRCVICHPATAELPGELLTSLSRRMGRMTICTDIFAALAECCLFQREASHLAGENGSGATAKPAAVLILVHPRHMPNAGAVRLVEAVRSYSPGVAIWRYDRSANPKLRAVVEEDVKSGFATTERQDGTTAATTTRSVVIPNAAPAHVNGTGHAPIASTPPGNNGSQPHAGTNGPAQRGGGGGGGGSRATSILTEDELRMLLSGDPFDGGPLGSRSHHEARPTRSPDHGAKP